MAEAAQAEPTRILVIDDDISICRLLERLLSERGHQVVVCSESPQAMDLLKKQSYNCVLLDVRMEELNGVETLRKIREAGKDTKVIMVTGVEDEEVINEANKLGALSYIHKPLDLDELEKIVMSELNGSNE